MMQSMGTKQNTSDSRQHILEVGQQLIAHKGFTAVGLAEILAAAEVPKGSFYHYFASKEAFGVAMLEEYFAEYDHAMLTILSRPRSPQVDNLLAYFEAWVSTQAGDAESRRKCLAVKLGSEVSDLSESMRDVLDRGTRRIMERLARALETAVANGEIGVQGQGTAALAETLYLLWLGAALMAKIRRGSEPLQNALVATRGLLGIEG